MATTLESLRYWIRHIDSIASRVDDGSGYYNDEQLRIYPVVMEEFRFIARSPESLAVFIYLISVKERIESRDQRIPSGSRPGSHPGSERYKKYADLVEAIRENPEQWFSLSDDELISRWLREGKFLSFDLDRELFISTYRRSFGLES